MNDEYEDKIRKIVSRRKIFKNPKQISIKNLGMGENNLNYLLTTEYGRYVFRISHKPHLEKNAEKEFKYFQYVPAGIGPKPLFIDKSKKIIPYYYSVLSYIAGKSKMVWTAREIRLHAKAMAELHSKRYGFWQTGAKRRKIFSLYEKYGKDMQGYKSMHKTRQLQQLIHFFENYIKINDRYFRELKNFRFIHGDLCADNIIFGDGKIHYIDWEWCGIRDNAEDLARVYFPRQSITPWYIKMSDKQINYMIDEYSKHIKDDTLKQRVEIWNNYVLFMDMMYFYWKIQNFKMFRSKLPKNHYVESFNKLYSYFKHRF